jgi:hypothetical protein
MGVCFAILIPHAKRYWRGHDEWEYFMGKKYCGNIIDEIIEIDIPIQIPQSFPMIIHYINSPH